MTPVPSMVGNLATTTLFERPWRRRAIAAVLVVLFGVMAFFPERYRAAVTLSPSDPASLGLGGALNQLGAFSSVFGNQAAMEISLKVARSQSVRQIVLKKLDLMRRENFSDPTAADRWLTDKVEIRSLRGGIILIESTGADAPYQRELVGAFAAATRLRLSEIARTQTAYKREILNDLVAQSAQRLNRAQTAYDAYRRQTKYIEPGKAIGAIGSRVSALEETIKQREISLSQARAFATDDNMAVRQLIAEIVVLKQQLAEARSLDPTQQYAVNRSIIESTRVEDLERELTISKSLYINYKRYLEGTDVEDLASAGNVRIIEPPFIDSARQYRIIPLAIAMLFFLIAIAMELYLLRPPIGAFRHKELARP